MKKLILSITLMSTVIFSFAEVPTSEKDALMALYNATDGANWIYTANWNTTTAVTLWYGVTVATINNQDHVTGINLSNNSLNGTLPAEIGDFPELKTLAMENNAQLIGSIPAQIGNLLNLKDLSFWNCNLSGTIPAEIGNCTKIFTISLEDNNLTGNIPESFANLTLMQSFWINGNQLSGEIPDIFSNWSVLDYFSIGDFNNTGSYNNFSGTLDFSMHPAMRICLIGHNNISSLNLRNGNNTHVTYFNASDNPNLTCIIVDNATYSTTYWPNIDPTTTFVETQAECDALGVDELTFESNVRVYPNPTTGIITIVNTGEIPIKEVIITNSLGQVITKTRERENINIASLPAGIYLIRIEDTKANRASYKIVKE